MWIIHSFIAMFSLSLMVLCFKKLTDMGVLPEIINLYFFSISSVAFLIFAVLKNTDLKIQTNCLWVFVPLTLMSLSYNYYSILAIRSAPNPGYSEAIKSFYVVIVMIGSFLIFGSELSAKKVIGILMTVAGLFLVAL